MRGSSSSVCKHTAAVSACNRSWQALRPTQHTACTKARLRWTRVSIMQQRGRCGSTWKGRRASEVRPYDTAVRICSRRSESLARACCALMAPYAACVSTSESGGAGHEQRRALSATRPCLPVLRPAGPCWRMHGPARAPGACMQDLEARTHLVGDDGGLARSNTQPRLPCSCVTWVCARVRLSKALRRKVRGLRAQKREQRRECAHKAVTDTSCSAQDLRE